MCAGFYARRADLSNRRHFRPLLPQQCRADFARAMYSCKHNGCRPASLEPCGGRLKTRRRSRAGLQTERPLSGGGLLALGDDLEVRTKTWITAGDETFLAYGRVMLLEKIRELGSISAAGRDLGMSYRRAWWHVETMNRLARRLSVPKMHRLEIIDNCGRPRQDASHHEKHPPRRDTGHETHPACADQLRFLPLPLSEVHADRDRHPPPPDWPFCNDR